MTKLLPSNMIAPLLINRFQSRIRVLYMSTESLSSGSFKYLYERIYVIRNPWVSIVPVLEKWVDEGRSVEKLELQSLIKKMKDFRRFKHALEISLWMSDRRYFPLSSSDVAIRLYLISRVHGLEQAEKFFENISSQLKTFKAYGALLNCYVRENSVEKAEALVHDMNKMGFVTSSFTYNVLINLYSQTTHYEKIENLIQEMKAKGIPCDKFTRSNLLNAYAAASEIGGMEKILNQMEEDPHTAVEWDSYANAANGYLNAGMVVKALEMLKKTEELVLSRGTTVGFDYLLTLYTRIEQKDELYRIWKLYQSSVRLRNTSYSCMINSLTKLDDIKGAEKIFEEWESSCSFYDFRVLNRLIAAYCKKGLFREAESVVKKAVESRTPYASTWNILAVGYLEDKQMSKAVEMLKNAMSVGRKGWRPNQVTFDSCLEYLQEQGDVERLEDFIKLYKASCPLTRDI